MHVLYATNFNKLFGSYLVLAKKCAAKAVPCQGKEREGKVQELVI